MKTGITIAILFLGCNYLFAQSGRVEEAEAYYDAAYLHYKEGDFELAQIEVEKSISLNDTPDSWFLSGLLFENEDKPLRAVSSYEAAARLAPHFREAVFKKALIYLHYGDPQQAVKDLTYLVDHYGDFQETRSILFQIDETGNRQNKIMTTQMMEADLYHYRSQAYQKLDFDELAFQDLNKAISLDPTPECFVTRGLYFDKQNRQDLARMDFVQAIRLDSTYQLAWYNLALIDPTVVIPQPVLADDQFSPILILLASREMDAGRLLNAKRYLDQAATTNQLDALVFLNRGRLLSRMNQYNDSLNDFQRALEIDPEKVEAIYLIGNAYFFQKEYVNALAYYNQYLAIESDNGMIWYNGAMCYLELNKAQEACHYLQMADQLGMTLSKKMLASQCNQD